jgi:DNA polymerase (family 10)
MSLTPAAAAREKDADPISDAFSKLEIVDDVLLKGSTKTSVRTSNGVQVDLRIVKSDSYGAALMYFTGSKEHNVKLRERALAMGMTLNEYELTDKASGRCVASRSEEEVYAAMKLPWIAPELREDRGEITLAANKQLPLLIHRSDILCDLHTHTSASDGRWSIRQLAAAAMDRGYHTVAITDHSKGQAQAHGLSIKRLEQQIQEVHDVAAEMQDRINVLAGSEVDILADGKLDYPDSLLRQLDIVVASPHAALTQEPAQCTKRLLKAIGNRYVTIIVHPTGRIVNRREGLHPDMPALFKAAAARGIALEVNANHHRLDLRDTHARAAIEAGVKLAINTDAHGPADFDELRYGLLTARRAGATANDVVNTLDAKSLRNWIAAARS